MLILNQMVWGDVCHCVSWGCVLLISINFKNNWIVHMSSFCNSFYFTAMRSLLTVSLLLLMGGIVGQCEGTVQPPQRRPITFDPHIIFGKNTQTPAGNLAGAHEPSLLVAPPSAAWPNGTLLAVAGGSLSCVGSKCPRLGRALVLRRSVSYFFIFMKW